MISNLKANDLAAQGAGTKPPRVDGSKWEDELRHQLREICGESPSVWNEKKATMDQLKKTDMWDRWQGAGHDHSQLLNLIRRLRNCVQPELLVDGAAAKRPGKTKQEKEEKAKTMAGRVYGKERAASKRSTHKEEKEEQQGTQEEKEVRKVVEHERKHHAKGHKRKQKEEATNAAKTKETLQDRHPLLSSGAVRNLQRAIFFSQETPRGCPWRF